MVVAWFGLMLAQRATGGRGRIDPVDSCAKRGGIPVEFGAKRLGICAKRIKICAERMEIN
jgi:hypothetical protein